MCFFAKVVTRNVYKLYSIPVISTEITCAAKIDYNCSLKMYIAVCHAILACDACFIAVFNCLLQGKIIVL